MPLKGALQIVAQCRKRSTWQGRGFIPSPSFRTLEELGIFPTGHLVKNGDHNTRVLESAAQGEERYMTSKELYKRLNMNRMLYRDHPRIAEVQSAAVLFRAVTMLRDDERILQDANKRLSIGGDESVPVEVPSLSGSIPWRLSGVSGWRVFTGVSDEEANSFLLQPEWVTPLGPKGLFVADGDRFHLSDQIPHAIVKMYASATRHQEKIVRGAVSNGSEWEFIILRLNSNGRGGGYKVSPRIAIDLEPDYPNEAIPPGPDILAGILAHWIPRCYHDLDKDDWFAVDNISGLQQNN